MNEDILDSLGEGLITVDKDFKVTFLNRAAEQITGYKKDETLGRLCKLVLDCELCETQCPIAMILETDQNIYDHTSQIKLADGNRKSIKMNAAVLKNGNGTPTGGVISFRDLSEREVIKKESKSISNFYGIIGHGKVMQGVFELINEISDSDAAVLIQGESGTGKEMIANAVQATSRRKNNPFIKVNCSVFPENLLASELFGHVKGAYTDALNDRPGRFELADGGTIFLDEVAEMPPQTQIQLLRTLQEGTFERVGESIPRKTDVRVIAATNINVDEALKTGKLREDLYYRINVIPIFIPPLRQRKEDIPYLVKYFIEEFSKVYGKNTSDITNAALEILTNHTWPGNIRELENVIEYAVVRSKNKNFVTKDSLPSYLNNNAKPKQKMHPKEYKNENAAELVRLLEKHQWNRTKVAEELGIGRTTLWRMLKDLPKEN